MKNHLYPEQYWRDGKGNIIRRYCWAKINKNGTISQRVRECWGTFTHSKWEYPWWLRRPGDGVRISNDGMLEIVNELCYRMSEQEAMEWYDSVKLAYLTTTGQVLEPPRYNEREEQQ